MNCPKCKVFLVEYMAYDGAISTIMLRCINCGLVTDGIVERNRAAVQTSQKGNNNKWN